MNEITRQTKKKVLALAAVAGLTIRRKNAFSKKNTEVFLGYAMLADALIKNSRIRKKDKSHLRFPRKRKIAAQAMIDLLSAINNRATSGVVGFSTVTLTWVFAGSHFS